MEAKAGDAAAPESPTLPSTHVRILKFLRTQKMLLAAADVAEGVDVDRKTAGAALRDLERLGYVRRPRGKRSGWGITADGQKAAPLIPL